MILRKTSFGHPLTLTIRIARIEIFHQKGPVDRVCVQLAIVENHLQRSLRSPPFFNPSPATRRPSTLFMSPRVPSTCALQALRAQAFARPYTCLRRRSLNAIARTRAQERARLAANPRPYEAKRDASIVSPVTSVNAAKNVPPKYKELYESLENLNAEASSYANVSRLQLALRGLESLDAVVRVAGWKRASDTKAAAQS
jgi:hypothetical protein